MSRIVRHEFMGNWWLFWLLCITGIGAPLALLYLVNGTLRIEEEIEDAQRFLEQYRARRLTRA